MNFLFARRVENCPSKKIARGGGSGLELTDTSGKEERKNDASAKQTKTTTTANRQIRACGVESKGLVYWRAFHTHKIKVWYEFIKSLFIGMTSKRKENDDGWGGTGWVSVEFD